MNNNSPKFKALLMKGMVARKKSVSIVTQQKQIKTLLNSFFPVYSSHSGRIYCIVSERAASLSTRQCWATVHFQ